MSPDNFVNDVLAHIHSATVTSPTTPLLAKMGSNSPFSTLLLLPHIQTMWPASSSSINFAMPKTYLRQIACLPLTCFYCCFVLCGLCMSQSQQLEDGLLVCISGIPLQHIVGRQHSVNLIKCGIAHLAPNSSKKALRPPITIKHMYTMFQGLDQHNLFNAAV